MRTILIVKEQKCVLWLAQKKKKGANHVSITVDDITQQQNLQTSLYTVNPIWNKFKSRFIVKDLDAQDIVWDSLELSNDKTISTAKCLFEYCSTKVTTNAEFRLTFSLSYCCFDVCKISSTNTSQGPRVQNYKTMKQIKSCESQNYFGTNY